MAKQEITAKVTRINDRQSTQRIILPKLVSNMLDLEFGDRIEFIPIMTDKNKVGFEIVKYDEE